MASGLGKRSAAIPGGVYGDPWYCVALDELAASLEELGRFRVVYRQVVAPPGAGRDAMGGALKVCSCFTSMAETEGWMTAVLIAPLSLRSLHHHW